MYTREETILRMNALGRAERPFFFVISHDLEHNLLFELPETGHERMGGFSLPLGGWGEQGTAAASGTAAVHPFPLFHGPVWRRPSPPSMHDCP